MHSIKVKILLAICMVISATFSAKAQAVEAGSFVAKNLAQGSLQYVGDEIGESIFGSDYNKNKLSADDIAKTVGNLLDQQTALLTELIQKTAEQITNDVTLNYLEDNMRTSMNKMEELIKYYDPTGTSQGRMNDLEKIEDHAVEAKAAFNSYYSKSQNYPELFWMVYARYANFAETLLVAETEKTIVNNLLESEGVNGHKNDKGKRLSNVAYSLLDDVDKFWFKYFPGHNTFGGLTPKTGCVRASSKPWILAEDGESLWLGTLATTLGRRYSSKDPNGPWFQVMNNSLARRMDKEGTPRHIQAMDPTVERVKKTVKTALGKFKVSVPDQLCQNRDFAMGMTAWKNGVDVDTYSDYWYKVKGKKKPAAPFLRNDGWDFFRVSVERNEMRDGDFTNPIVPNERYTAYNYRGKTSQNRGILQVGKYKYFTVPDKSYETRWLLKNGDWEVFQFNKSISDEEMRNRQIGVAFDRYNEYFASFLPSDFDNEAYVKNLARTVLANWNLEQSKIEKAEKMCTRLTRNCENLIKKMEAVRSGKASRDGFELFN